jgi:hypothetical protein
MTILDPVFVISCVAAFVSVFQHLCASIYDCVSASMFQHLLCVFYKQSIAINDNLDHLRHLCYSHIPTISPFGIDGNMSFIAPPLTSRAKG